MNSILDAVRRRTPLILVALILGALVPTIMAVSSPTEYRAETRLFVATSAQDVLSANQGDLAAQSRIKTYAAMATGPELMGRAAARSGEPISAGELAGRVTVATTPGTVLLDISATAESPTVAAKYSQAVADELVSLVAAAEKPLRSGQPSLGLLVLQPGAAGVEEVPMISPLNVGIGAAIGLVAGISVAALIPARVRFFRHKPRDISSEDGQDAEADDQDGPESPSVDDGDVQTDSMPHPRPSDCDLTEHQSEWGSSTGDVSSVYASQIADVVTEDGCDSRDERGAEGDRESVGSSRRDNGRRHRYNLNPIGNGFPNA